MPVRKLHIEGFGHFCGFSLTPAPGLNVVFGPNEAGKTTLAAFLRYVLFDHEQHRVAHRAQALAGGRLGGRIEFDAPGGPIQIERIDARNALPSVRVVGLPPQTGDAAIRAALGGVDAPLFRAVFSLSLDDLSGLNALNDTALRDRLFMGALAGAGRDVSQALARLEQHWSTLYRPRSASEYTDAVERADALRARLNEAQESVAALTRRQPEIEHLRQAQRRAREAEREATEAALRARALLAAAPHHTALARTQALLDTMPVGRSVDPGQREALQSLDRALRDAELVAVQAETTLSTRRAECAGRARASPLGPFEPELSTLEVRLRERSPTNRQERAQAAALAQGRVEQGLRELGLPDAHALRTLDLSVASTATLRSAARAAEIQSQRLRAIEGLTIDHTRRVATLERRAAERTALPSDPEALELAAEVDALSREAPAISQQKARLSELETRIGGLRIELQGMRTRLGDFERATDQPAERARFAAEVRAWRGDHLRIEARAAQESAEVDRLRTALAELQRADAPPALEDSTLAPLAGRLLSGVDAAIAEDTFAVAARQRAEAAELRARDALAALGPPFTASVIESLQSTPSAREALRGAARGLLEARAEVDRAAARVADAAAEAKRRDAPLEAPRLTPAELDAREDAVDAAESAVRARDEATLRAGRTATAPTTAPPWALWAGLLAGLLLVALGIAAALQGSVAAGGSVALLGAFVALAAWRWLRPAPTTNQIEGAPPDEVSARAAAALAAVGLPASADAGSLAAVRAEMRRERRRAEVQIRFTDAREFERARRADAALAAQRWDAGLAERGWPRPLAPEALDTTLAEVLQIRETLDTARREADQAREGAARFTAFCALTTPWAAALGLVTPTTADSARSLAEEVRRAQARAADRASATRTHLDRVTTAQQASTRAEANHRTAAEALATSRQRAATLEAEGERLGVPQGLGLDTAIGWLDDAAQAQALAVRLADHREQVRQGTGTTDDWQRRVEAVASRLGLPMAPDAAPDTLIVAQARSRRAAELAAALTDADAECRRAQFDLRVAEEALAEARREAERDVDALDRWRREAARVGLPPNVLPEAVETFLMTAERVSVDARLASEHETALALDAAERAALRDEVGRIAEAIGEPRPEHAAEVEAFVRGALTTLTQERVFAEETTRLEVHCARAEEALAEANAKVAALHEQAARGWAHLGLPDLPALDRLTAEAAARAEVAAEARAHRNARDAALGVFAGRPELLAALDEAVPGTWEVDAETAAREADAARRAADAATVDITRLETQLESAAFAREIPELQLDLETARADAARARRSMVKVTLAKQLLQRTLERYREAHQPAILKTAGEYLAAATQGVYTGVETAARDGELLLVDAQGGRRESRHLSRGTTELLYLILRFGLAGQIGAGKPLPLVLDDVLVNLDADRAAAVARLVAEVATRHQVLLLTCRAETRDLLLSTAPEALCVELPRFAGRGHPIAPVTQQAALPDDTTAGVIGLITAALRAADQPLTRAELQTRLPQIPEAVLQSALQQARDQGSVLSQGAARGTRYLLR